MNTQPPKEARKNLVDEALDELVCPLCMGTFVQPLSLSCLHSYCENCLVSLVKATNSVKIDCPECRAETQLPPGGVKDLRINFKLKRLVDILTVEERQKIIVRESFRRMNRSYDRNAANTHQMCPVHKDKLLEYYCAPCKAVICGQCMIDEHRIHGEVRYVSEILDRHVSELRNLVPELEKVKTEGEAAIKGMKDGSRKLEAAVESETSKVQSYFDSIREILKKKEEEIVSEINKRAKKKEKLSLKHIGRLNSALEEAEKCRLIVEDTVEQKNQDLNLLLVEQQIRSRVFASMKQVEEQVLDSRAVQDAFCSLTPFSPEDSVESACRGLHYMSSSPIQTRLYSTSLGGEDKKHLHLPSRSRSDAILPPIANTSHRPFSISVPNRTDLGSIPSSRSATVSCSKRTAVEAKIIRPASEINRKNLIGPYNNVTAYPYGVCSLQEGTLLVTDCRHHLFRIITATGKCLETIGTEGKGDGQFSEPTAITTDSEGCILVADGKGTGRIQKFSATGMLLSKFKVRSLTSGVYMTEPGGLAVANTGNVLVTDVAKSCVHEFDKTGKYQGKFGNLTDLKEPSGIAASKTRVVLTDRALHCIFILTQHGHLLSKVSQQGSSPGDLHIPHGVAISSDGYIFVSESGNHRISIFTPGGKFKQCFGSRGSESGKFDTPRHICFNHQEQLVVCDEQNQRVQLFDVYLK